MTATRLLRTLVCLAVGVAACSANEARPSNSGPSESGVLANFDELATIDTVVPVPPERTFIGTPFSGDSLANLDVGGSSGAQVAYRFVAERDGRVETLQPFLATNDPSSTGYAHGTGGTVQVSIVADNGSGLPDTDAVLAVGQVEMQLVEGLLPDPESYRQKLAQNFPKIEMSGLPLKAGATYHAIFEQLDPDPVANRVGVNLLYQYSTDLGPRPTIEQWGVTRAQDGMDWQEYTFRDGGQLYSPILAINMADGYSFGNGYIGAFSSPESYRSVDRDSSIQVRFSPDADLFARRFWLRAARVGNGSGSLLATLEGSDGSVDERRIGVEQFDGQMSWTDTTWEHRFGPDVDYTLTLTADGNAAFEIFPLRDGKAYEFEPGSAFDGVSRPSNGDGGYEGWHKDQSDDSYVHADIMMAWTTE